MLNIGISDFLVTFGHISTVSYVCRWTREEQWQIQHHISDFRWMYMAEPIMKLYTEATDGSYIETKESALVWHHQDAGPRFGPSQAKELLDHLESVLINEPVSVKSGQHIVEVKPQVLNFSKTTSCTLHG
jgi:trehalose 6-phosphate synthase/phosphatase